MGVVFSAEARVAYDVVIYYTWTACGRSVWCGAFRLSVRSGHGHDGNLQCSVTCCESRFATAVSFFCQRERVAFEEESAVEG